MDDLEFALRTRILTAAGTEADAKNGIRFDAARVAQYMTASAVHPFDQGNTQEQTKLNMARRSWCSDYVYFVLQLARHPFLPIKASNMLKIGIGGSIARFVNRYKATTTPKPGDLYVMPVIDGKQVDHIGFYNGAVTGSMSIVERFNSLDGNSINRSNLENGRVFFVDPEQTQMALSSYYTARNQRNQADVSQFLSIADLR